MVRPVGPNMPARLQQADSEPGAPVQQQPAAENTEPKLSDFAKNPDASKKIENRITEGQMREELVKKLGEPKKYDVTPDKAEEPYFRDANGLDPKTRGDDPAVKSILTNMIRSDVNGSKPGVFSKKFPETFQESSPKTQQEYRYAMKEVFQDKELTAKIDSNPAKKKEMEDAVKKMAATDPSIKENEKANAAVDNFKDWDNYKYRAIIVPGYTDPGQKTPIKLDPVGKERLDKAAEEFNKKPPSAPFIIVSGGNCHPKGTRHNEAYEMKQYLINEKKIPADRIIVDMQAQHSTTNLRNAGRYMHDHKMIKNDNDAAMVVTGGGKGSPFFDQKFYMAKPEESTFHKRCKDELGYKVGDLTWVPEGKGTDLGPGMGKMNGPAFEEGTIEFRPSKNVKQMNYKDPLDP